MFSSLSRDMLNHEKSVRKTALKTRQTVDGNSKTALKTRQNVDGNSSQNLDFDTKQNII